MTNKFKQYVTRHKVISPKKAETLACFCHFDTKNQIADYVVHYVKELAEGGADVFFVSNCPQIEEAELAKITPYVAQIILRQNIGYDFAAYFTGYSYSEGYESVVFANDSVYGPFYPLAPLFVKMKDNDMWGISDAYAGRYHIQSYFWVFNNMQNFLDKEAAEFEFIDDKAEVVGHYEEGITQKLIAANYKIAVLCDNKLMAEFAVQSTDKTLQELKGNIQKIAQRKVNIMRQIKGFLCPYVRRKNSEKIYNHANLTGIFSCWYAAIKYFDCPFIKVGMLKKSTMEKYHEKQYIPLLKNKYPAYDWQLIEKHLGNYERK